ncbi:unnamed protein product [Schistosoma turkestanicum]|nr:unnamed protein product [Schistosoma turkestanicum]
MLNSSTSSTLNCSVTDSNEAIKSFHIENDNDDEATEDNDDHPNISDPHVIIHSLPTSASSRRIKRQYISHKRKRNNLWRQYLTHALRCMDYAESSRLRLRKYLQTLLMIVTMRKTDHLTMDFMNKLHLKKLIATMHRMFGNHKRIIKKSTHSSLRTSEFFVKFLICVIC